jgi:hypothetical protein
MTPDRASTTDWLMDSDPAVRWQVMQDLLGFPAADVTAERAKIARSGWGAELLSRQDEDGRWAGALYSPKWTSTTYTLLLLHWLGLPPGHPQARTGLRQLWDGAQEYGGGITFTRSVRQPEACITGMLVLLSASFGDTSGRAESALAWLLDQQLSDGGWNCESIRSGSRHGSFHTSITALDALLTYQRSGGVQPVDDAMMRGREFFLRHHLYRSHTTGEVVDPAFTRFPFPPQWHFDALRGLEHFRMSAAPRDDRLAQAVDLVRAACDRNGRWRRYAPYPGRTWLRLEPPGPSRWTTLRCLRVLDWWDRPELRPVLILPLREPDSAAPQPR